MREAPGTLLQAEAGTWATGLEVGEPQEELAGDSVGTGAGTPGLRGCRMCACRTGVWVAHVLPEFQEQTLGTGTGTSTREQNCAGGSRRIEEAFPQVRGLLSASGTPVFRGFPSRPQQSPLCTHKDSETLS